MNSPYISSAIRLSMVSLTIGPRFLVCPQLLPAPNPSPWGGTSLGRLHQNTLADSESHLSNTAMQERCLDCRAVALFARQLPITLTRGG